MRFEILIADTKTVLLSDYGITIRAILSILPDAGVRIIPVEDAEAFSRALAECDGLITAFLPVDGALTGRAPKLKCVSVSAVSYNNVDVAALRARGIGLCHVTDYCTHEVAEHTLSLMLSLNRRLKPYTRMVEVEHRWQHEAVEAERPLCEQSVAVFGLGHIGREVCRLAAALGMEVMAVSEHADEETLREQGIRKVTAAEAFGRADVISNHTDGKLLFDDAAFARMKRKPLFINTGRGSAVSEKALVKALDGGAVRGAGLDVLAGEPPPLEGNPLLGRENVVLTPHSGFYSSVSPERLMARCGENLAYFLHGQKERVREMILNGGSI